MAQPTTPPSATPDLSISLSAAMLQFALDAYSAESFIDRVFEQPSLGVKAIGQQITLVLSEQKATLELVFQGNFQLSAGKWRVLKSTMPLRVRLVVGFEVVKDQLYLHILDNKLTIDGPERLIRFLSGIVDRVTHAIFTKPLLMLPLRMNLIGTQTGTTDETHLQLSEVAISASAVRLAFHLRLHDLPSPPILAQGAPPLAKHSRQRAVHWVREGVQAYQSGAQANAAAYFARACLLADPSYELAWLWLASLAHSDAEKRYCLERAIAINPENSQVRLVLNRLAVFSSMRPDITKYPLHKDL